MVAAEVKFRPGRAEVLSFVLLRNFFNLSFPTLSNIFTTAHIRPGGHVRGEMERERVLEVERGRERLGEKKDDTDGRRC